MRTNYWLDPEGHLHTCGPGLAVHDTWARDYLINQCGWTLRQLCDSHKCKYQILHDMGWVRIVVDDSLEQEISIMGDCINLQELMFNTMDPRMTPIQLTVAKCFCDAYGFSFMKAINDKKLWPLI